MKNDDMSSGNKIKDLIIDMFEKGELSFNLESRNDGFNLDPLITLQLTHVTSSGKRIISETKTS